MIQDFTSLNSQWSSLSYSPLDITTDILIGDRSWLQAGQSSTFALCLWNHTVIACAKWGLAVCHSNNHRFFRRMCHFHGSICHCTIQIYASASKVSSHICKSPIPWALMYSIRWQMVAFAPVADRCLDSPLCLGMENSMSNICLLIDVWISTCITKIQVAFHDTATDC